MIHVCRQINSGPAASPLIKMSAKKVAEFWENRLKGVDPGHWTGFGGYDPGEVRGSDYFSRISSYEGALGQGWIYAQLTNGVEISIGKKHKINPIQAYWALTLEDPTRLGSQTEIIACSLEVTMTVVGQFDRRFAIAPGLPMDRFATSMWTQAYGLQQVYLASTEVPDQWDKWERPKPEGMHSPFLQWLTELPWGVNSDFDYDAYYPTWLERVQTKQAEASVAVA